MAALWVISALLGIFHELMNGRVWMTGISRDRSVL